MAKGSVLLLVTSGLCMERMIRVSGGRSRYVDPEGGLWFVHPKPYVWDVLQVSDM